MIFTFVGSQVQNSKITKMKTYKDYKNMVDRMKTAHKQNQLKSNTNTPDTNKRQDKIQDLENRSGSKGKSISWKGLE